MYQRIINLCNALNMFTMKELSDNGIEALLIYGLGKHDNNIVCTEFVKGSIPEVLGMIGASLSQISNKSKIPLDELLLMIFETETKIKEGGDQT